MIACPLVYCGYPVSVTSILPVLTPHINIGHVWWLGLVHWSLVHLSPGNVCNLLSSLDDLWTSCLAHEAAVLEESFITWETIGPVCICYQTCEEMAQVMTVDKSAAKQGIFFMTDESKLELHIRVATLKWDQVSIIRLRYVSHSTCTLSSLA